MSVVSHAVAAAGSVHKAELLLFFTLVQLTLIVLAGRVGGALATRWGQSAAVGEIIVGILLGPSLFGLLAPEVPSLPLERVMLDIHSGRLLGRYGPFLVDGAAFILLLLSLSGIWIQWRSWRQKHRHPHKA